MQTAASYDTGYINCERNITAARRYLEAKGRFCFDAPGSGYRCRSQGRRKTIANDRRVIEAASAPSDCSADIRQYCNIERKPSRYMRGYTSTALLNRFSWAYNVKSTLFTLLTSYYVERWKTRMLLAQFNVDPKLPYCNNICCARCFQLELGYV